MLLASVTIVALVAVSFGVGWFASSTDERTGVSRPPAVHLRPLPVPRIVIQNGPWADPPRKLTPRDDRELRLRLEASKVMAEVYRLLGMDPPPGFFVTARP